MDGWKKSQVSLSSTIKAKIQEESYPETFGINTVVGLIGKGKGAYTAITEFVAKQATFGFSDWVGGFFGAISATKDFVMGLAGVPNTIGASSEPELVTKQFLNGTIDTKGLITSSTAITNMYAPTFEMNRFETTKSTLGQGVWNLKHAPIVYQGNISFYNMVYDKTYLSYHGTAEAALCMFDPTSVEVELNPNVFRDQEIEYVHVTNLCGVRKGVKHYDNDEYRKAYGMEVNKVLTPMATMGVDIMNKVDKNRPFSSIIITTMRIILTICQKKTQNV